MTALQASTSYGVGFAVSSFPAPPRTSPNRRLILASGTTPVHFSFLTVIPPLPILLEVHFSSELLRRIVELGLKFRIGFQISSMNQIC